MSKLANCRSQFLLDRLGRSLKLFVSSESTSCHKFASQFGLAIFVFAMNAQNFGKPDRPRMCLFEWSSDAHCRQWNRPSRLGATNPSHSANLNGSAVCVRARVRACVRDVFSIYDNNIWPRLIMIIIKIIILLLSYISYKSDTLMIPLNGYPASIHNDKFCINTWHLIKLFCTVHIWLGPT